jgi:hypothetical protein
MRTAFLRRLFGLLAAGFLVFFMGVRGGESDAKAAAERDWAISRTGSPPRLIAQAGRATIVPLAEAATMLLHGLALLPHH